jgi:hypothetical protein
MSSFFKLPADVFAISLWSPKKAGNCRYCSTVASHALKNLLLEMVDDVTYLHAFQACWLGLEKMTGVVLAIGSMINLFCDIYKQL